MNDYLVLVRHHINKRRRLYRQSIA